MITNIGYHQARLDEGGGVGAKRYRVFRLRPDCFAALVWKLSIQSKSGGNSQWLLGQRELDSAVALHEQFLRRAGGERAVLKFAVAPGVECRRRVLNDADFTGAVLNGAVFAGSHFERASFYAADLTGCDLRAANLKRADLRGACLAGSVLNGAVLDEADMRAAAIVYADQVGTLPFRSRPRQAGGVVGADFSHCAMRAVRLWGANLKGANFSGAVLHGADLSGAKLTDAVFHDTVLSAVALDQVRLSRDQLDHCILDPSAETLKRAPALLALLRSASEWADSEGRFGAPAVIDDEDLRPLGGAFRGRLLPALSARNACGIGLDFSGADLQGAAFDGADLRGAVFEDADLRGASFRRAKLSHARFARAELKALMLPSGRPLHTSFEGASVERVDFSNTVFG